jgi:hypothetical protein
MRFSKPFRIFAISLLATLTLIIVTSAVLSFFYEKAMVRYLKKYLDEHLATELSMKEIRFRVLKGFPNATVEITRPVLLAGKDFNSLDFGGHYADTLLYARSVSFQFDLLKLFRKEYELKKIEVSQGGLNVLIDKSNRHNLKIWKTPEKPSGENYTINLKSILFSNMRVRVVSAKHPWHLAAFSRRTTFRGAYSGSMLTGETRGSLALDSLSVSNKQLIRDASLQLSLKIAYGGNRFRISQGRIHLNKVDAGLSGEYTGGRENSISLTVDIPNFGLDECMSLLPAIEPSPAGNMIFSGNGRLHAVVSGSLKHLDRLLIKSDFELNNGTARNKTTGVEVRNIRMSGTVSGTRADNFELKIDQFNSSVDKGTLGGNFYLRNLKTLDFRSDLQANLDLESIRDFINKDTLEVFHGQIRSQFTLAGSLRQLSDSAAGPLELLQKGIFNVEDAGFKLAGSPWEILAVNGKASWDNGLRIDSVSARLNGNDLLVSGSVQHLTGYLLKRQTLKATVEILTDNLNINKLLSTEKKSARQMPTGGASLFPPNIQLHAQLRSGSFTAGKFRASDLSLVLDADQDSIYVNRFNLSFPDGTIAGSALITRNPAGIIAVTCHSGPQNINIQQLFTAFNNFTQHFIVDKNVRGQVSGTLSFYAQWDDQLKFMPESIKAQADIAITNGELVQFEPMLRLSRYIDLEELRHIRFSTLKNVFYITNQLVTVPEMVIHSTAFNIKVSGQHSFDNVFDYRLKVLLSEVLFNKARKKKQEIDEFLVEENREAQTTIPLIIAGTPDQFDVRFDHKRAFDLTRKPSRDPALDPQNRPAQNQFIIEWEEPEQEAKKPPVNSNGDDFIIEWDEDKEPDNE